MDDVVGGFGHRAIAIGGGVGFGVVQRREAGETPFAKDADKVSLL
jgi:branched-subunit amino acid ABC-type transport system permease component